MHGGGAHTAKHGEKGMGVRARACERDRPARVYCQGVAGLLGELLAICGGDEPQPSSYDLRNPPTTAHW